MASQSPEAVSLTPHGAPSHLLPLEGQPLPYSYPDMVPWSGRWHPVLSPSWPIPTALAQMRHTSLEEAFPGR